MRFLSALVLALSLMLTAPAQAAPNKVVTLQTSMGPVMIMLYTDKAPKTVENFLRYVQEGFYDGTVFHRIINSKNMKIVQGGGFEPGMRRKQTHGPIVNEAIYGLKNERGTIAMARTQHPDSATSQFFINLQDNDFLNATPENPGYCAFGKVVRGMDVLDKMVEVPTGHMGRFSDVPLKPILLKKATIRQ